MANFCYKCGARLENGLCPNCDADILEWTPNDDCSAGTVSLDGDERKPEQNSVFDETQREDRLPDKKAFKISEINNINGQKKHKTGRKKRRRSGSRIATAIVLVLAVLATTYLLSYFNIIDIPLFSKVTHSLKTHGSQPIVSDETVSLSGQLTLYKTGKGKVTYEILVLELSENHEFQTVEPFIRSLGATVTTDVVQIDSNDSLLESYISSPETVSIFGKVGFKDDDCEINVVIVDAKLISKKDSTTEENSKNASNKPEVEYDTANTTTKESKEEVLQNDLSESWQDAAADSLYRPDESMFVSQYSSYAYCTDTRIQDYCKMRFGPSKARFDTTGKLVPNNSQVTVETQSINGWTLCVFEGAEGWIRSDFLFSYEHTTTEEASNQSDAEVVISSGMGGWWTPNEWDYDEDSFEYDSYVSLDTENGSGNILNIRSGPSLNQDIKDTINNGTKVHVCGHIGNWSYIEYNGNKGWCMTSVAQLPH